MGIKCVKAKSGTIADLPVRQQATKELMPGNFDESVEPTNFGLLQPSRKQNNFEPVNGVERYLNRFRPRKVQPPLRKLPSFVVNSTILEYLGYHDEVKLMLCKLSLNAFVYV